MESQTIDPTDPAVMTALKDDVAMQVWECLRTCGAPSDVVELSGRLARPIEATQKALDMLEAAQLVRKIRASRHRRAITYTTTCDAIVVVVPDGAEGRRVYQELADTTLRRESAVLARLKPLAERGLGEWFFEQVTEFNATTDELQELQRKIYAVSSFVLELAERRAVPVDAPDGRILHAVQLRAGPLLGGLLRLPQLRVFTRQAVIDQRRGRTPVPAVLGLREWEIAKMLQGGASRADVAERLGISIQTVGSHCKRIFAKLGVRRAIELQRFDFAGKPSTAPAPRRRPPRR